MRALRRCDFCEAEAVGTFEVVPPALDPTEAEQRRVVLCDDCSTRLETLLEPLLDRLDVAAETPAADAEPGTVAATSDESTARPDRSSDPNAMVSGPAVSDDAEGTADDAAADVAATADDAAEDADGDSIEGITVENDAGDESDRNADAEAAGGDRDGEPETKSTPSTRPPKAYAKVVRLLRNREFPMERDAVESLAAGAYELESHEVEAIVDRAIENGEFAEDGDRLRRHE